MIIEEDQFYHQDIKDKKDWTCPIIFLPIDTNNTRPPVYDLKSDSRKDVQWTVDDKVGV